MKFKTLLLLFSLFCLNANSMVSSIIGSGKCPLNVESYKTRHGYVIINDLSDLIENTSDSYSSKEKAILSQIQKSLGYMLEDIKVNRFNGLVDKDLENRYNFLYSNFLDKKKEAITYKRKLFLKRAENILTRIEFENELNSIYIVEYVTYVQKINCLENLKHKNVTHILRKLYQKEGKHEFTR